MSDSGTLQETNCLIVLTEQLFNTGFAEQTTKFLLNNSVVVTFLFNLIMFPKGELKLLN